MNLFRSEEHIRSWAGYAPAAEEGIISLTELVGLFSVKHFTRRLDPDYFSRDLYAGDLLAALTPLGRTRPFWSPPNP